MELEKIQNLIVRLDSLDKMLTAFKEIAAAAQQSGGIGKVEIEIRIKADQQPQKRTGYFFGQQDDEYGTSVADFHRQVWGLQQPQKRTEEPVYKRRMEIKPNEAETMRTIAIFVDRLLSERATMLAQLKAYGIETNTQ